MHRPKVAHITTVALSLRSLLLNQLGSLQAAGYEVVGISTPDRAVPEIEAAGIRHIPVPMTRAISPLADLRALATLTRTLRRERFVVVHTHTPKPGLIGQIAARLARVPIVINTLHGFYFHEHMPPAQQRFYSTLEKLAATCSTVILSQNREDIETALRTRICAPDKIKYLGNGIDLTRFDPHAVPPGDQAALRAELGLTPDTPVMGFVGRLAGRRKGFLDFLRAGQHCATHLPTLRLLIIGTADVGKPDAVGPETAHEFGIADRCLFLGNRPNHLLPRYYNLMDVLVLPSLFEGIPRVVMEAAAMGVPAVVTNVKGNREAVQHDTTGLHVPLGDVDALSAALLTLLSRPDLAQQMGDAARAFALRTFDEQQVFARIHTEYRELLAARGLALPE